MIEPAAESPSPWIQIEIRRALLSNGVFQRATNCRIIPAIRLAAAASDKGEIIRGLHVMRSEMGGANSALLKQDSMQMATNAEFQSLRELCQQAEQTPKAH